MGNPRHTCPAEARPSCDGSCSIAPARPALPDHRLRTALEAPGTPLAARVGEEAIAALLELRARARAAVATASAVRDDGSAMRALEEACR